MRKGDGSGCGNSGGDGWLVVRREAKAQTPAVGDHHLFFFFFFGGGVMVLEVERGLNQVFNTFETEGTLLTPGLRVVCLGF